VAILQQQDSSHGPDLVVSHSNGTVVLLPGIGSDGTGSGFFRDTQPQAIRLGSPIVQSLLDPATGVIYLVRGDGGISAFNGTSVSSVFSSTEDNVTMIALAGDSLVAAFANGEIGLLEREADGDFVLAGTFGLLSHPSALEVLEGEEGPEVVVTVQGSEVPLLLTHFIPVVTELPYATAVAQGTGLTGTELVLVATLLNGGFVEQVPGEKTETVPSDEVFALFQPTATRGGPLDTNAISELVEDAEAVTAAPEVASPAETESAQSFLLGASEGLRQLQGQQRVNDAVEDALHYSGEVLRQLQSWLAPPAGAPAQTVEGVAEELEGVPAALESEAEGAPLSLPVEPRAAAKPVTSDVFACADLLPTGYAPVQEPTLALPSAVLAAWLAHRSPPRRKRVASLVASGELVAADIER
jgi:hypothetical protein